MSEWWTLTELSLCARHCAKGYLCLFSFNPCNNPGISPISIPISEMGKLRHRGYMIRQGR